MHEALKKKPKATYNEIKPSLILEKPTLKDKGRALEVFVGHFLSTYEPEEKETEKSIKESTHKKHMVKQAQKAQNMDKADVHSTHETGNKNDDKSIDGSTKDDHNSTESTIIPSSIPQLPPAVLFTPQPPPTGTIQAKTLENKSTPLSDQIKTFHLFEQGLNSLKIMEKLNVEFDISIPRYSSIRL
ncbi:MAG TPA: hypothetical protein VIH27_00395 [Nitrososphaerales archaeon]